MTAAPMQVGVDLVRIGELDRLVTRPWFLRLVYAASELSYADGVAPSRRREFLAGRFAAKEAMLKVLGTGLFRGIAPREIVVDRTDGGAPTVRLTGAAAGAAARLGLAEFALSITHKRDIVAAVAVGSDVRRAAGDAMAIAAYTASEVCAAAVAP